MFNLDTVINNENYKTVLPLSDAEIIYYPRFFSEEKAQSIFEELLKTTPWKQDPITIFGKTYLQPRLTALYGEQGKPYTYSGIKMLPHYFTPLLIHLKQEVEKITQHCFSTVLLNLYRTGSDSNGWHSDNEKELGINPTIASLSFGASRFFHLKHKKNNKSYKLTLSSGSLLIMKGETQHKWLHQIPKTKQQVTERINLTFRTIY